MHVSFAITRRVQIRNSGNLTLASFSFRAQSLPVFSHSSGPSPPWTSPTMPSLDLCLTLLGRPVVSQ